MWMSILVALVRARPILMDLQIAGTRTGWLSLMVNFLFFSRSASPAPRR